MSEVTYEQELETIQSMINRAQKEGLLKQVIWVLIHRVYSNDSMVTKEVCDRALDEYDI